MACPIPWRKACIPLVTNVGKIKPAKATSGGNTVDNPEIRIVGMAKPVIPLIKPENTPIISATTNTVGVMI